MTISESHAREIAVAKATLDLAITTVKMNAFTAGEQRAIDALEKLKEKFNKP